LTKDLQENLYLESLDDLKKEVEEIDGLFINSETSPQMTMYKEKASKDKKYWFVLLGRSAFLVHKRVIGLILDIYNDFSCQSFDECQRIYPKGKGKEKMYKIHPFEGYYRQDFSQYFK
jgi:hypothetical protein